MAHPQQAHSEELATLLALREHGSFVGAGRALQRHATVLSKRLASLEARLGVRLVERTTRQLRFTEEGERLVEKIRHAVDLIADAEDEAASGAVEAKGLLRIALPAAMGRRWLSPMVATFVRASAHPVCSTCLPGAIRSSTGTR